MGNSISVNTKDAKQEFKNFYDVVDYIATYYILTMDFKSLSKLSEKAYCDKLVVLTSDIIERYFNETEVTFLAQRIKNGVEVNELNQQKVRYINKDNLESLDISNDAQKSIKKKRVCIGIAKFYVKIAHIFAAIVTTINPVYTYKDDTGQTVKTVLLEKDKIPKNAKRKLYKLNICDNRIRALKRGEIIDDVTGNVTIQPKVCNMNVNKDGSVKDLMDEPGIPELMNLYLDDNYDYSSGKFTGMSEKTKTQFMTDLKTFYTTFTGNAVMPQEITKFSDIKLRDHRNKQGCQGVSPIFKSKITLDKKDKLFVEYAENIKKMIQIAANNQYKLLSVINELFTYIIDPYSGKRVIRINPKLSEEILQNSVIKTRRFIIDLYVKCETDYVNGMKIYEAIVESKILDTTQNQINLLKTKAKKIIKETKTIVSPVKPALNASDEMETTNSSSSSYVIPIKRIPTIPEQSSASSSSESSSYVVPIKRIPTIPEQATNENSVTAAPTQLPAQLPAQMPAQLPAQMPAQIPAQMPAQIPTQLPTQLPAQMPAQVPTQMPAQIPNQMPSQLPTQMPAQ